jgi:mRNA-degrading endonuclease YafQ of YafQ-DinJ toxin-antitoxin module
MEVSYKPSFVRQYKILEPELQMEVKEKIGLFSNRENHEQLKVHKLKGRLSGRYSFSVNYRFRIVFAYLSRDSAALLAIGDHDVYK